MQTLDRLKIQLTDMEVELNAYDDLNPSKSLSPKYIYINSPSTLHGFETVQCQGQ